MIKHRIAAAALAASLVGTAAVGTVSAQQSNKGGAAGLVAAVVQIATDDVVNVKVVDSFNNLRALNNVLNNSPILSDNTIVVTDVIDIGDVSVLNGAQITALNDFLNDNNVDVDAIVGVAVLSSQDLILISR